MVVFDTTFLIQVQRLEPSAIKLANQFGAQRELQRVPAAAWIEFLAGFDSMTRHLAAARLERTCAFAAVDRETADIASRLQHDLVAAGRRLSWHDVQIAATAIRWNEPLVSADTRFLDVPGLEILPIAN